MTVLRAASTGSWRIGIPTSCSPLRRPSTSFADTCARINMPDRADVQTISTIRTFIAANLDPGLKVALARVQDRLKATHADVGWVRPENLHITLKFLGQVEESHLGVIREAIAAAAAGCGPAHLVFQGLGAFPRPREARVVWIGLSHGAETLAALQTRIEVRLESLGFAREARPFTTHLTLGRVRGDRKSTRLNSSHHSI